MRCNSKCDEVTGLAFNGKGSKKKSLMSRWVSDSSVCLNYLV